MNEKIVERTLREYLPFLATENIMMEAVKRGGDRQELHEKIRQHSMAATARMKEGEPCDLLDRLAGDPAFGMTREELDQVMDPSSTSAAASSKCCASSTSARRFCATPLRRMARSTCKRAEIENDP